MNPLATSYSFRLCVAAPMWVVQRMTLRFNRFSDSKSAQFFPQCINVKQDFRAANSSHSNGFLFLQWGKLIVFINLLSLIHWKGCVFSSDSFIFAGQELNSAKFGVLAKYKPNRKMSVVHFALYPAGVRAP